MINSPNNSEQNYQRFSDLIALPARLVPVFLSFLTESYYAKVEEQKTGSQQLKLTLQNDEID